MYPNISSDNFLFFVLLSKFRTSPSLPGPLQQCPISSPYLCLSLSISHDGHLPRCYQTAKLCQIFQWLPFIPRKMHTPYQDKFSYDVIPVHLSWFISHFHLELHILIISNLLFSLITISFYSFIIAFAHLSSPNCNALIPVAFLSLKTQIRHNSFRTGDKVILSNTELNIFSLWTRITI